MNNNPQSTPQSPDDVFGSGQPQSAVPISPDDAFGNTLENEENGGNTLNSSSSEFILTGDRNGSDTIPLPENEDKTVDQSPQPFPTNKSIIVEDDSFGGSVSEAFNSILRAGASGVGRAVEGLGTLSDYVRSKTGDIGPRAQFGQSELDQSLLVGLGEYIQDTAKEMFPDDPTVQNTFLNSTLPGALGSTLSYLGTSAVGGGAATAIQAGFELGQSAFDEAIASGADDDTAMQAFLFNAPLGGVEAIPMTRLLGRINRGTGGTLAGVIKEGAVGGVEEAVQETAQQVGSNAVAAGLYDETRDLIDGVAEGGAAGFITGMFLNSLGAGAGNRMSDQNLSEDQRSGGVRIQQYLKSKGEDVSAVDPIMGATIPSSAVPFAQDIALEGRSDSPAGDVQRNQVDNPFASGRYVDPGTTQESQGDAPQDLTVNTDSQTRGATESELRERGAFTTQSEKGPLTDEFINNFVERGQRLYKPIPDNSTIDDANAFVDDVGVSAAKQTVLNRTNGLLPRHRVAIGQKVLSELDQQYRNLESENSDAATAKLDEQISFADQIFKLGTELGRGVRAFAYHSKFSPQSFVRMYQREVDKGTRDGKDVTFDQEVAREIARRGAEMQKLPEGFQRDEATIDLMSYIAQQSPVSNTDIAISMAYANLLSGHETQIVNFTSTGLNTLLESITLAAANPSATSEIFRGLFQGLAKGIPEAKNIVKTGKLTGSRRRAKLDEIPDTLEQDVFTGVLRPLNNWKYVRRIMAANDIIFFKGAEEMRARSLAHKVAKDEGLTDTREISKRVNEILGTNSEAMRAAETQADQEGLTGNNRQRRINEIIQQGRPDDMVEAASEFALRSTFNQPPEGVLGWVAQNMNAFTGRFPLFKTVVPFTNVVSNVTNMMLDYTPVGLTRLRNWTANPEYQLTNVPEYGTDLWRQQAAKGVIGTMGMVALAVANMEGIDEDNDSRDFMVTGKGPENFRDRFQLQETGWKPYSVKVNDTYFSFRDTPMGLMLSTIGNYHDAIKYGNLSEHDLLRRVSYVMKSTPQTILDMSFLTGLSEFFTSLSRANPENSESLMKDLIETGRGFVIPNLVKQVDQIFDPKVYTSDDIEEALIRDIPVARTLKGKPIINVLGEPIRQDYDIREKTTDRFLSVEKSDPIWRLIVNKNAYISHPSQGNSSIVGLDGRTRDMTADEYYNYIKFSGEAIRKDLQMNLPRLQMLSEDQAQKEIRSITRARRNQAENLIRQRFLGAEKN